MEQTTTLLLLAAFLFATGVAIVVIKKNTIIMLMGLELMLSASNINLVVFNRAYPDRIDGQVFAIFIIIIAVCEAAVLLGILLRMFRHYRTSVPDEFSELKG